MFTFGIVRMITETLVNPKTGDTTEIKVPRTFLVDVDLDAKTAVWQGKNRTPFEISDEIMAWVNTQV